MHRLVRFLSFAIVGLFAVAGGYALRDDLLRMSAAPLLQSWDLALLAVFLSLSNYALRIMRWRHYLSRLGHSLPVRFMSLTYIAGFAFTLSPGKVGEVARARYYSRLGMPFSEVAGAFFVERLTDLLAMMLLAALVLASLPHYRTIMWIGAALVALCVVCLSLVPWPAIKDRLTGTARVPRPLASIAVGIACALSAAQVLLKPGVILYGLAIGLAAWGMEGAGLYALSCMFPAPHLSVSLGVGIYAVAILVGALSFLPGGLGSTEAVMAALLTAHGFAAGDALLATLLCRLVTLWLAVCIGWVAVLVLRNRPVEVLDSW